MNLNFRTLAALCSVAVSLSTGCRDSQLTSSYCSDRTPLFPDKAQEADVLPQQAEEADFIPAEAAESSVTFGEDCIGIRGEGVRLDGNCAVISKGGVYSITDDCVDFADGRVIVDTSEPVSLILSGLSLKSDEGAAIEAAKGCALTLTVSRDSAINGGILAGDVVINGSAGLEITADNAISCASLKMCGANLDIVSSSDGIAASSYIIAAAGNITIDSAGDGIKTDAHLSITDGTLNISSELDSIQAQTAVIISGGEVKLSSGGGSSAVRHMKSGTKYPYGKHGGYSTDGSTNFDFSNLSTGDGSSVASKKGIKSSGFVEIIGGSIDISSADDCIYAKTDIELNGGTVNLSSGDDALHAANSVAITDGGLFVRTSYTAVEGMNITINGGTVELKSYYDGITAAGGSGGVGSSTGVTDRYISISGGSVTVDTGGDGINSSGTIAISGGETTVFSPDSGGFGSMVYGDSFALSGGVLRAFGSADNTMAPMLVSGSCISLYAHAEQGSSLTLSDSSGRVLFSVALPRDCGSVIFSSTDIAAGETYTLTADGAILAQIKAQDGICGGGPDGRNTGSYDDITTSTTAVAA